MGGETDLARGARFFPNLHTKVFVNKLVGEGKPALRALPFPNQFIHEYFALGRVGEEAERSSFPKTATKVLMKGKDSLTLLPFHIYLELSCGI